MDGQARSERVQHSREPTHQRVQQWQLQLQLKAQMTDCRNSLYFHSELMRAIITIDINQRPMSKSQVFLYMTKQSPFYSARDVRGERAFSKKSGGKGS